MGFVKRMWTNGLKACDYAHVNSKIIEIHTCVCWMGTCEAYTANTYT